MLTLLSRQLLPLVPLANFRSNEALMVLVLSLGSFSVYLMSVACSHPFLLRARTFKRGPTWYLANISHGSTCAITLDLSHSWNSSYVFRTLFCTLVAGAILKPFAATRTPLSSVLPHLGHLSTARFAIIVRIPSASHSPLRFPLQIRLVLSSHSATFVGMASVNCHFSRPFGGLKELPLK